MAAEGTPTDALLAPPPSRLRIAALATALCAGRLAAEAAPSGTPFAAGAALVGAVVLLAQLPALAAHRVRPRTAVDPWSGAARDARAALAASLLLVVAGLVVREALSRPMPFAPDTAPWPVAELVGAQALLFAGSLLPLPGSEGALLLAGALRRSRPQLVAERLAGRVRGSAACCLALLLALAPGGGSDPLSWATALAWLAAALLAERAAWRRALAREHLLQEIGTVHPVAAAPLRPLAPAQFQGFAGAAARAYDELAGVRASSHAPAASAASSSPTDGP